MAQAKEQPSAQLKETHATYLFYGLHFPELQPRPKKVTQEHEQFYQDRYTLEELLALSTTPERITLILDVIAQEMSNLAVLGELGALAEYLLTMAPLVTNLQEVSDLFEIAETNNRLIKAATVEAGVMLEYVKIMLARQKELHKNRQTGQLTPQVVTAQGRRWIYKVHQSAKMIADGLAAALPTAVIQTQQAMVILDGMKAGFLNAPAPSAPAAEEDSDEA